MSYYLIEFAILSGLFALLYIFFLQGTTQFNHRRIFLKLSLLASLLIPLLPQLHDPISLLSVHLPSVLISPEGANSLAPDQATVGIAYFSILKWTFLLITSFFVIRFVYGFVQLLVIVTRGKKASINNQEIIFSEAVVSPGSFLSHILLPAQHNYTQKEINAILLHESLHIRFAHSIEKIIFEIQKALFWWHPVSWFYAREISIVHEYQVDNAMTKSLCPSNYKEILLQFLLHPSGLRMANPFSSNIKKRIKMMNTTNKRPSTLGMTFLFLLFAAGSLTIHSCRTDESQNSPEKEKENVIFFEKQVTDTLITFDSDTKQESQSIINYTDKVYTQPTQMPLFPGCIQMKGQQLKDCSTQKLLEFVYTNILYPKDAKDAGLEGIVVSRFVVDKDGFIRDINVVRSPDESLSDAVEEMMSELQKITWIPGKQEGKNVSVQYTLPVKFKLE